MALETHLSDSATRELEEIQSQAPSGSIRRWIECTDALEKHRKWSRRALAENHLVAVASHLHRKLRIQPNHFDILGIPVDLLEQFPRWHAGSRAGFRAQPSGLKPSHSGAASPIGWMRVQLSPAPLMTPYALVLLRDLLRQMDSSVRFTVPAVLARRSLYANHFLSSHRAREVVRAGYDAYARERHPKLLAYSEVLEKCGYRVVGMPDLRIDPQENLFRPVNFDFSYCNVLPGLRRGRPAVHYLPWGIRPLDEEAERKMRLTGVDTVRVSSPRIANLLMSLSGGLHCFCGPLQ